jgi:uncharacterized membrane protein YgcG
MESGGACWFVGAFYGGTGDQTPRFLEEGIWENGYEDKYLSTVLAGQPDPGPPQVAEINLESTFASAEETDDRSATLWVVDLLLLATLIPMVTYFWYAGILGR